MKKGMLHESAVSREAIAETIQISQGDSGSDAMPPLPEEIWETVTIYDADGVGWPSEIIAADAPFVPWYDSFPWRFDTVSHWAAWEARVRDWIESAPNVSVDFAATESLIRRSFEDFGKGGKGFDREEWKAGRLDLDAIVEGLGDGEAIQGLLESSGGSGVDASGFWGFEPVRFDVDSDTGLHNHDDFTWYDSHQDPAQVDLAVSVANGLYSERTFDVDRVREALTDYVMHLIDYNWHAFHAGSQTATRGN